MMSTECLDFYHVMFITTSLLFVRKFAEFLAIKWKPPYCDKTFIAIVTVLAIPIPK